MKYQRLFAAVVIAGSLAGWAGAALAEGTASSPAKKELVTKVLALQKPGIESMGNALASQTANQVLQAAGQALLRVPADKREAVAKDFQAEVRKFYEDIAPTLRDRAVKLAPSTIGATLEEKFSEDELKALVAWLDSPVNRKFQQVAAQMQQGLGEKVVADARPLIEPKLKALDQALGAKLKAAGVVPAAPPAAKPASAAPAKK
jgi:hypothetical protein